MSCARARVGDQTAGAVSGGVRGDGEAVHSHTHLDVVFLGPPVLCRDPCGQLGKGGRDGRGARGAQVPRGQLLTRHRGGKEEEEEGKGQAGE